MTTKTPTKRPVGRLPKTPKTPAKKAAAEPPKIKYPQPCDQCGKPKPAKGFRQLTYNPVTRTTTCLTCLHAEEEKDLAATIKEHGKEKATKIEVRRAKKEQTRQRAYYRRVADKEKQSLNETERELARRILAKRRLIHFIKRFEPGYKDGWVHHDICRRLEKFYRDVRDGKAPRLMLFMPPRHGKSLIASNYFPSWVLGHSPEFEIIASSYAVSLPIGFSRKIRGRLREQAYSAMFPDTAMDPENSSAEGWMTTMGGGYVAAGVGGGITGKGAHVLIIDDPIKDAEEADSETVRDKIRDWYDSTAYTRLAPGGGVLVIQTRWHDADLSGQLVSQMKEQLDDDVPEEEIDQWEIVSYPAIATSDEYLALNGKIVDTPVEGAKLLRMKDEALHSDRFDLARLKKIRRTLMRKQGARFWSALYQQNPVPDEGVFFKKDMFRLSAAAPSLQELDIYIAWDLAVGQKQTNDYSVGVVGGLDWNDRLHILEVVRGRWDTHELADIILKTYARYNTQVMGIERGQLELAVRPQLRKLQEERRIYPTYDMTLVPITDKTVRARPLQGRMQQGMVTFPLHQPWVETAQHEMLRFPGGVHDDIVDALAWLVRMVMKQTPPSPPTKQRKKSWKTKLKQYTVGADDKHPMAA